MSMTNPAPFHINVRSRDDRESPRGSASMKMCFKSSLTPSLLCKIHTNSSIDKLPVFACYGVGDGLGPVLHLPAHQLASS